MVDSKIPWWCPTFEKDPLTLNWHWIYPFDLIYPLDLSTEFIHSLSPLTLPLPPHPQKVLLQRQIQKNPSLHCSYLGLSWVRLSLLGSLHFSLEPKKAEEAHDQTHTNFSVVLWHGSSEIPAPSPSAWQSFCFHFSQTRVNISVFTNPPLGFVSISASCFTQGCSPLLQQMAKSAE